MKQTLNLAVLGPGKIAEVVMEAIKGKVDLHFYAVASRDINRAKAFQEKHHFEVAYGSYEELYLDDAVDLIYIATPHAFHFAQMKECIKHKKNILCEKAFTLNLAETEEILSMAKEYQVFVAEAMLTAYLPSKKLLQDILKTGIIGELVEYKGVFANKLMHVERVVNKSLGGGSLLDIGIYPLYFAISTFGKDFFIENIQIKPFQGIDETAQFTLKYPNGFKANIYSSISEDAGIYCEILGTKGRMYIENVARPSKIVIYDIDGKIIRKYENIRETSGYEYEFIACVDAIQQDKIETPYMQHEDTRILMKTMEQVLKSIA